MSKYAIPHFPASDYLHKDQNIHILSILIQPLHSLVNKKDKLHTIHQSNNLLLKLR